MKPGYLLCNARHPTMQPTIGQGVPACGRVRGHRGDHVGMLWNGHQVRWPVQEAVPPRAGARPRTDPEADR